MVGSRVIAVGVGGARVGNARLTAEYADYSPDDVASTDATLS
jgi:hypothetical protein